MSKAGPPTPCHHHFQSQAQYPIAMCNNCSGLGTDGCDVFPRATKMLIHILDLSELVANTVVFLASDEASFVNGTATYVDNG